MIENVIEAEKLEDVPFDRIRLVQGETTIVKSYANYLMDESKVSGGKADLLFFPNNEQEVATIIKKLRKEKHKITISAARTGIVGSAIPLGGAILVLERMNKIEGIGFDEKDKRWFVRVQPAISLQEINDFIKTRKFIINEAESQDKSLIQRYNEASIHHYPVDPTEMTASIGGTIGTNASGSRTFKFGPTRDWVRRIRVVISSGEVLDIPRNKYKAKNGKFIIKTENTEYIVEVPTYKMPNAKNAAGLYAKPEMDLIDLFIGSEGIFGVITEAEVWVKVYDPLMSNIAFFDDEKDALDFVYKLRNSDKCKPDFIEYFDKNALDLLRQKQKEDPKFVNVPPIREGIQTAISFDIFYTEETLEFYFEVIEEMLKECNSSLENTWSAYEEREITRLKNFRHVVPEIVNNIIAERKKQYPAIHKLGTDMSVEDQHLVDMMRFYHSTLNEAGLEYVIWGHIGNNHVHVNILPRNLADLELGKKLYMKFAEKAVEYGGSVSAEHGIGKIKHEYLEVMYGEEGINQMRAVKKALDPDNIFNAGNIFNEVVK